MGASLAVMRPFVIASVFGCGMLLASTAAAQTGEVVVPPGYGTSGTVTGTVTITTTAPTQGTVVTAPPRMPAGRWETQTRERSIRGLWLTGLIALPISWILTWSVSSTALPTYSGGIAFSYIPVVGPWLMLTEPLNGYDGFAVTMGIVQATAATLLILGLVLRETVEEQVWVVGDLGEGRTLALDASAGPTGGHAAATLRF